MKMTDKEGPKEEKQRVWGLVERIVGKTEPIVNYRPDWRVHRELGYRRFNNFFADRAVVYDCFSKGLGGFFGVRSRLRLFFVLGSHQDVLILPSLDLQREIQSSGCVPSQEYGDYKATLRAGRCGIYFREAPSFDLAPFQKPVCSAKVTAAFANSRFLTAHHLYQRRVVQSFLVVELWERRADSLSSGT